MQFKDTVLRSYPTGSRYICNPAPTDTDNDTVILVNGYFDWEDLLHKEGWEDCGKDYDLGDFKAFRKGEENYIVTEDPEFFSSFVKSTEAAKALNLLKKEDRITLFEAVRNSPEGYVGLIDRNENKNIVNPRQLHEQRHQIYEQWHRMAINILGPRDEEELNF